MAWKIVDAVRLTHLIIDKDRQIPYNLCECPYNDNKSLTTTVILEKGRGSNPHRSPSFYDSYGHSVIRSGNDKTIEV